MHLSIMIVIGICAMLTLAMGIIFFVILYQRRVIAHQVELKKTNEQKELELIQASIRSEEQERMRIAAELHDDVNATLSSAKLFLYKEQGGQYADEAIGQAKALLDESILKIRAISHKLQPAALQHLGLEQSLQALIETIGKTGAITTRYSAIKPLPRMNDTVELSAYRIAQELVTNILKHSQATILFLETDMGDREINLLFSHDGQGLTQDRYENLIYKQGATGLKNILSRLKSMNAAIRYDVTDELQYHILLTLPYEVKPPDNVNHKIRNSG